MWLKIPTIFQFIILQVGILTRLSWAVLVVSTGLLCICGQQWASKGALLLGVGSLAAGAAGVTGPRGTISPHAVQFIHIGAWLDSQRKQTGSRPLEAPTQISPPIS